MSPRSSLINGAKGRMGQAVASRHPMELGLSGRRAVDVGDDLAAGLAQADVVVDFSSHHGHAGDAGGSRSRSESPLVLGTTGHSAEEKKQLLALAAARCPACGRGIFPSA